MFRKMSVLLVIAVVGLLALTTACSSTSSAVDSAGSNGAAAGAPASATACPTAETKKFAKTRFVADAALAGGAFKRYIYTPAKEGKFQKGAHGRVTALIKAAAAGAFTINRLNAAKANAENDPALCRALIAPLQRFSSAVSGLVGKTRHGLGSISPSDVNSGSTSLSQLHSAASQGGSSFTDNTNASI